MSTAAVEPAAIGDRATVVDASGLAALVDGLTADGRTVIGPRVGHDVIELGPIDDAAELPWGVADEQSPGHHRLVDGDPADPFGWTVPSQGWKRVVHPPEELVVRIRLRGRGTIPEDVTPPPDAAPRAFVGMRPCDLHALRSLDDVAAHAVDPDERYSARRADVVTVVVECARAAPTCFCASMGTGPAAGPGADVVLTPVGTGRWRAEARTPAGHEVLDRVPGTPASTADHEAAAAVVESVADTQVRAVEPDAPALAAAHVDSDLWDDLDARCLACANCTMVCPTCPCTHFRDTVDLAGELAERHRHWDSCFDPDFSYIHPEPIRRTVGARYRQWLLHKLATWQEQFDEPGCVGCGRCITWCPVGIDITAEVARAAAGGVRRGEPV